jgi:DNA-binding transcriptional ArsR family regulator
MAFSKAKLYEEDDQITALYFKAFSHPARIKILKQLRTQGPCAVEDLARDHPINDTTFSEHLQKLRVAGLITYKEQFPYVIYEIVLENVIKAECYINEFLGLIIIENLSKVEVIESDT